MLTNTLIFIHFLLFSDCVVMGLWSSCLVFFSVLCGKITYSTCKGFVLLNSKVPNNHDQGRATHTKLTHNLTPKHTPKGTYNLGIHLNQIVYLSRAFLFCVPHWAHNLSHIEQGISRLSTQNKYTVWGTLSIGISVLCKSDCVSLFAFAWACVWIISLFIVKVLHTSHELQVSLRFMCYGGYWA